MKPNLSTLLSLILVSSGCQSDPQLSPLAPIPPVPIEPLISLQIKHYLPLPGNTLREFFISNFSVKLEKGQLTYSTSRDGLSDAFKAAHATDYGFNPDSPTSNLSGLSDLYIYLTGTVTTHQTSLNCAPNLLLNSSGDLYIYQDSRLNSNAPLAVLGLRDCEKLYMGLDVTKFDYTGGGIPDYLKLRCGLNPKNSDDINLNPAGDGISNLEKCKRHLPIDENAKSKANQLYAYQYSSQLNPDGTYDFTVANIPVMNEGQDNFIAIYIVEVNTSTQISTLATGFSILNSGVIGKKLTANYWGTFSSKQLTNVRVAFQ